MKSLPRHSRPALIAATIVALLLIVNGCSRKFWRTQADFDSLNLLEQKQFDSRWDVPRTTVDADLRSRFYDPYNLDCEPLPPDDPAANQYMTWVYGMRGYKSWHKFGESMTVENPQWLAAFDLAPETVHDPYRGGDGLASIPVSRKLNADGSENLVPTIENLTLGQCIELASLHSRDYQTQLENLFLSSLQLSLDQFQFNVRYLGIGGKNPTGAPVYTSLPGGGTNFAFPTQGGVSQVLPSGGQWIVGLANNTMWLFSGGQNNTTSQSILSYSLVQPLLQGAGRKVILENLTASERNVLYNVRLLARYRKLFFADTVANTSGGSTSSGAAISPTSGTAVTNPTVISTNQTSSIAPGTTVGSQSASALPPQGYYGILFQLQQVLNQHQYVEFLKVQADRLQELVAQTPFRRLPPGSLPNGIQFPPELAAKIEYSPANKRLRWFDQSLMTQADRDALLELSDDPAYVSAVRGLYDQMRLGVTTLEILQVATALTAQQVNERRLLLAYHDEIDQYKFFLGLPTDMQITIDRSMLKPFELADQRLVDAEAATLGFIKQTARVDSLNPPPGEMRKLARGFIDLVELVRRDGLEVLEEDFRKVRANTPLRLSKLMAEESREMVKEDLERDEILLTSVRRDFSAIDEIARQVVLDISDDEVPAKTRAKALGMIKDAREDLLTVLQNLRLLQVAQRSELITLQDFDLEIEEVVAIALENRLDLMNARAKVMDSRRNMEVAANRLEAVLNVVVQGNVDTKPGANHPLDFRGAYSTYQFGLQMTAPLDQMQARNIYRSSLVTYQQARRAYMLLEDQVKYDVRTSWRQLKANRQNFEVSRKNLRQAALQFDINVSNNLNPKASGGATGGGTGSGAGGGAITPGQAGTTNLGGATGLNLLNALNAVLTAQNNLIQYWASYERNRINIYRDMDIMQVDERGLWIDPVYQNLGGRSDPSVEEPANVTPPEPAAIQLNAPDDEGTGIVQLVQGPRSGKKQVATEGPDRPRSGNPGIVGRWRDRLAGRPVDADADDRRDGRAGH